MAETGHIALVIAFSVAAFSAFISIAAVRFNSEKLLKSARIGILTVFGLYTLALVIILFSFFTKDFSLRIVAEHTSRDLSPVYTLSALYADKAGSMFFWGWLVSLFSAIMVSQNNINHRPVLPFALLVLAVLEVFFIALVTFVVNVFARHPSPPLDGFGLNPLLQNAGMLVHPPLLYLGFAAFGVVFALVIASLATGNIATEWNARIRTWTVFAWCTLGIGNLLGMWWSYNELGWGGYWAWDPVENAGLMPWLLGTAFLHSISMKRRRNYLQTWSFYLIVFTFAFTLLSPFITHGGIESPLHGFYGSPFPPYILAAILVVITGSLALLFIRRRNLQREDKPASLISREGAFLITNVVLVVLVFIMLLGTVLPGVVKAFGGTRIALDRTFFDRSCGPIMLALVFLMGVCPLLGWSRTAWHSVKRNLLYIIITIIIIAVIVLVTSVGNWYAVAAIICGVPLVTIFLEWYRGVKARFQARGENPVRAFWSLLTRNRARYGGFIVHIGIVLIALGIIGSSFYSIEKTETLNIGDSMNISDYRLSYSELVLKQDNQKVSAVASLDVIKNHRIAGTMHPSYNYWFSHNDHFAEVTVRTTPAEDLFVSLVWTGYDPGDKSSTFRVLVNPLIVWIWVGGGFMLLGGTIAFSAEERQ